ncbi:ATP-dependent zinc metalloprotease FtsH [Candidatus Uhrbacteria bacterium]|nr:ATP-dependent zinc metalloprotease FtsH [Candidatus Uhrbacteria bacterium]
MTGVWKNVLVFLVVVVTIGALFSMVNNTPQKPSERVGTETLVNEINASAVKSIDVKGDTLLVTLVDDRRQTVRKEPAESLSTLLRNYNIDTEKLKKVRVEVKDQQGVFWLNAFVSIVLPFLILGFFIFLMVRQVQGANNRALTFGLSRARQVDSKNQKNRVTFTDVAGATEAKEELEEVIEFLRDPQKFTAIGAKIPKGVMLVGAPGTGKTLLAKAVAGEADVPFFHVSGSEFIEMFVGVGASRVRDLFTRAKKNSPCIVFIDEIDAVGRQRGAGLGGGHDEREQTLNQILVELDGFEATTNVIVIAATNRPDVLDPALLRPGRFDRRVVIDLPSIVDREQILAVHARNKPFAADVELKRVAERTPGFSGADLANLLNEAAILAARKNQKEITLQDVLSSIEKVILGPERKTHFMSVKEKKVTAYHEGGHALVSHFLPDAPSVQKISIISRGRAAGYTLNMPTEDKHFHTKTEFKAELAVLLGGYTAEKLVFGDVTTGASNDLKKATHIAKKLITDYGMSSELGPRTFGEKEDMIFLGREITEHRDYSEKTAEKIDREITTLIAEAQETATEILSGAREKMETLVHLLLEKETIERDEFAHLFPDAPHKTGHEPESNSKDHAK